MSEEILPPGSPNSSVWCRNMDELIGAITHGFGCTISPQGHFEGFSISNETALSVIQGLIDEGKAEVVPLSDGYVSWNIYPTSPIDPTFTFKKR